MKLETMLCHFGEDREDFQGAVVAPIFQNSLFTFPTVDDIDAAFADPVNHSIYTRGRNPSVAIAEAKIAQLCSGEKAKLFGSGMSAISAAILRWLEAGDHIVTLRTLYGPTSNFIDVYLRKKFNVSVSFVSGEDPADFESALRPNTRLIYLESPSSLVFSLQDIAAVASIARSNGVRTIIDNTWATPLFQKPLEMGIDLEVHSCSKYLGGHSDLVAGVVVGKAETIDEIFREEHALFGGKMAPFEGWLLTRSLRTLPLRMERHQQNAIRVAQFLDSHSRIRKVFFPGLETFPQYALGRKQMTGYSGLLSFELDVEAEEQVKDFVNGLRYFKIGVSWGGHESLIYPPGISYSKELSAERFQSLGISVRTIRISVGLENADDLIEDLGEVLGRL